MTSASGSFQTEDNCRIAWRTDGDAGKPPLLLANSLGTNLGMWDQQVPAWADAHYVIRFDMRGHGGSEVASEGFGIDRLGRDALELLDHLKIARCDFVGLSLGGMIGQWLGVNAPERLGRLVLTNTSAYMGPPESWDARIAAVRSGGMGAIAGAVVERWFTPAFRRASAEPDAILQMLLATDPEGYCGACAAIRDMDQRTSVGGISLPTLVIGGTHDPATPPEHAEFLAGTIPAAALEMLPAAHLSNIECSGRFGELVLDFLCSDTAPQCADGENA